MVIDDGEPDFVYWPVCSEWQKIKCQHLGLDYVKGNHSHISEPQNISRLHNPQARGRIVGDGNCFFRALAVLITGSQEDHVELRALITTYLSHNADQFSSYLKEHESIIQYLKISKMDTLTVWATEIEIFAAAQMLQTSIYVYAISGGKYTWLEHAPIENVNCSISQHFQEAIYLTNISNHYETVKRME